MDSIYPAVGIIMTIQIYDCIHLIKDYYDLMTDRLKRQIIQASPYVRIQRQVKLIEKVYRNQRLSSYRNHSVIAGVCILTRFHIFILQ